MKMKFTYRKAKLSDVENLEKLIESSARNVNKHYYSESEINAALGNVWTVDEQLIQDNTYWIVENQDGKVVGCGGWSKRKLLFGKNEKAAPQDKLIPGIDAARIRAFFVDPNFTRMGIGKEILKKCEQEAILYGFDKMELVATLSGEKLYSANGYVPLKAYEIDIGNGITNEVISMYKSLIQ